MKFVFADNLDMIDPNFDFIEDRYSPDREIYWDDRYPHEIFSKAPYDGILVSKAIVGGTKVKGHYTAAQAMRFNRVGAREFLRYPESKFPNSMMVGDCGAFSYHKMEVPPILPKKWLIFTAMEILHMVVRSIMLFLIFAKMTRFPLFHQVRWMQISEDLKLRWKMLRTF